MLDDLSLVTILHHCRLDYDHLEFFYLHIINGTLCNGLHYALAHIVRFSWMCRNEPQMFPPRSGNAVHSGRGFTFPMRSTLTGYLSRCPFISVTLLEKNCSQFCSPILRTCLMHSRLSGLVKLSSKAPMCSAQSDIL
jgi:hypothetical protein